MKNLKKVSVADISLIKLGVFFCTLFIASFISARFLDEWRWVFFAIFVVMWLYLMNKFTKK